MDYALSAWCIASVPFGVIVILHLCLCRLLPAADRLRLLSRALPLLVVATFLTTRVFHAPIMADLRKDPRSSWIMLGAVALGILFVAGLSLHSAITHSVRLKLGDLLAASSGHREVVDTLISRYGPEAATQKRIDQLVDGGYLERTSDALRLTRKGFLVATISSTGKRLFNAGRGG